MSGKPRFNAGPSPSEKDDNRQDNMWEDLKQEIENLYDLDERGIADGTVKVVMSKHRYMQVYTRVYDFMIAKHHPSDARAGQRIYNWLNEFLRQHLSNVMRTGEGLMGEEVLTFYVREWEKYSVSTKVLTGLLSHLDSNWVWVRYAQGEEGAISMAKEDRKYAQQWGTRTYGIYQLALVIWNEAVFEKLHKEVTSAVLKLVERERHGEVIDISLASVVFESFVDPVPVSSGWFLYGGSHFYGQFLRETYNYYATKSLEFLAQNPNMCDYVKRAEQWLQDEHKRVLCNRNRCSSFSAKLMQVCAYVLIKRQLDNLIQEFKKLILCGKCEDLGRIYQLVARLGDGLGHMQDYLQIQISSEGTRALDQLVLAWDPNQYVSTIIDIHAKYSGLVSTAFKNDKGFVAALDKACVQFVNNNAHKASELLARYANSVLKISKKNLEDQELDKSIENVMIVFKYLRDKDVFQKFFSKMLAKRLLRHISASDEAELTMIAKLKLACGSHSHYALKLQSMYQDIGLSKELNDAFKKYSSDNSIDLGLNFSIHVLSAGSWPFLQSCKFSLPAELEQCVEKFNAFYKAKHGGRKLSWLYNRCGGDIIGNGYTKNRYTFQTSTFQMTILLMYNDADSYKLSEIAEATSLTADVLHQVVRSLLKARLLTCPDADKELRDDSELSWFQEYENEKLRVNINVSLKFKGERKREQTLQGVEEDRKILIQATIVRIMKMRQVYTHQKLVAEVTSQLANQFIPRVPSIKKCIEILIEKEYLERVEGQHETYSYVA